MPRRRQITIRDLVALDDKRGSEGRASFVRRVIEVELFGRALTPAVSERIGRPVSTGRRMVVVELGPKAAKALYQRVSWYRRQDLHDTVNEWVEQTSLRGAYIAHRVVGALG